MTTHDHDHDHDHDQDQDDDTTSESPSESRSESRSRAKAGRKKLGSGGELPPLERKGQQQAEVFSNSPFARVLTDFMWNQKPPWTSARLAAILGVHRNRASNWLYHGMMPDIATMFAILSQLGIPMQALLDAFDEDGLPVPQLTYEEAANQPGRYRLPIRSAPNNANTTTTARDAAAARQAEQAAQAAREWETMLAHTRTVMAAAGMPDAAVEALLAHLDQQRSGSPSPMDQRIAREHTAGERTPQFTQPPLGEAGSKQQQTEPPQTGGRPAKGVSGTSRRTS